MNLSVEQKIIIVELAYKIFGKRQAGMLWREFELPEVYKPHPISAIEQQGILNIQNFLSECTVADPLGTVPARKLYEAYGAWCRKCTMPLLSEKAFAIKLENMGVLKRKGRINLYLNMRLAAMAADSQDLT